jgi:hypothetical protein
MKRALSIILICVALGMIYGKLATIYHWYLPPNWLAYMTHTALVETQMDLAYLSLYLDAALAGLVLWILLRLAIPQLRSTSFLGARSANPESRPWRGQ